MATEVLRPYDCLAERVTVYPATVFPRRRNFYNHHTAHPPKPTRNKNSPSRSDPKRKQSEPTATVPHRSSSDDLKSLRNPHNHYHKHPLMGQVTILRRGEPLDLKAAKVVPPSVSGGDLIASGTERLGPDPTMVGRQIRIKDPKPAGSTVPEPNLNVYAGSAFAVSPAPEFLPLPSFSKKKQVTVTVDASATRDLRRLLRLE